MNGHSCKSCKNHYAILIGIIKDDDEEKPIFNYFCRTASGERLQPEAELEFGCGLFKERI